MARCAAQKRTPGVQIAAAEASKSEITLEQSEIF
jgi:hypothetical protein